MKNAFVLAKKDASAYFQSWIGIVIFVFFYVLAGIFFSFLVLSYARISAEASQNAFDGVAGYGLTRFIFSSFFLNLGVVLMFLVPLLSMRALAEERKMQTLELLYTYPLSDFEIVWGKHLGMLVFLVLLSLPLLLFLGIIYILGGELDWGPVLVGFLGFILLANAYTTLGLFISSLTENQIVSAIVTFVCLLVFWILDWMAGITDGGWSHFLTALSPLDHYREFAVGIFDLSHFCYFLFFHVYFLFLTLRSVEVRNWQG